MTLTLTELKAINGGDEVCVTVEIKQGENKEIKKLFLLSGQYTSLRIRKGEISAERFDEIARAADIASAYKKGLFLLGYGACSERKLKFKLRTKGFSEDVSSEAVKMLVCAGCIDEKSDAVREAEKCLSKLWGRKRIIAHLYTKGFAASAVNEACTVLDGVDFTENCRKLIEKEHKEQLAAAKEDIALMAKLCAALQRMGYSFSEIREASENASD